MTNSELSKPKICRVLDNIVLKIGLVVGWANVMLIAAIIINVVMRYAFGFGQVWLEEVQWHLYGLAVMIGLSYSQVVDSPIRVDILHQRFSPRTKAFWEIFGTLVFLLPWIVVIIDQGIGFWSESWRVNESSDSPLGLPWRWIIKSVIPISFTLLGMAAVSRLISSFMILIGRREA